MPMNIARNDAAEVYPNGTPASVAMAWARYDLPVPGGPTSNRPRLTSPPMRLKSLTPRSRVTHRSAVSRTSFCPR